MLQLLPLTENGPPDHGRLGRVGRMEWLSPERYASELQAETDRLAAAAARRAPSAVVPTCPDWTVRDLVTHVGSGHRYATGVVAQGRTEPVPWTRSEAPAEQAEWAGWLAAGARGLTEAVRERGFDGKVWTWQPAHQTAGFWLRRMLHDEIVHRFDAEPDGDLAPDLAVDGVTDILLVLATIAGPASPRPRLRPLAGTGETLQFTATDTPDRWQVTLVPTGVAWQATESAADVTLTAPVTDLLLALNRRRPPTPGQVTGDRAVFDRFWDLIRF
jgi:uncharacterized protein (TIGR03083 family)